MIFYKVPYCLKKVYHPALISSTYKILANVSTYCAGVLYLLRLPLPSGFSSADLVNQCSHLYLRNLSCIYLVTWPPIRDGPILVSVSVLVPLIIRSIDIGNLVQQIPDYT